MFFKQVADGYKYFAFYSETAAQEFGSNIYSTYDGREVRITAICREKDKETSIYNWADKIVVGRVKEWVRKDNRGNHHFFNPPPADMRNISKIKIIDT
jgi:hypothetical protein